jgi:hypothetical protein
MKFCYADPPYHGMGKKMYASTHDDAAIWDDKQTHIDLVAHLTETYPDGWALSCNPRDLTWLLPNCPEEVRVCAWVKTFHQIRPGSVQYAWEPLVLYRGRKVYKRKPMVRDWISCPIAMRRGLQGAKPDAFNDWVLQLLNVQPGDDIVDLFPGSGGLLQAGQRAGVSVIPNTEAWTR